MDFGLWSIECSHEDKIFVNVFLSSVCQVNLGMFKYQIWFDWLLLIMEWRNTFLLTEVMSEAKQEVRFLGRIFVSPTLHLVSRTRDRNLLLTDLQQFWVWFSSLVIVTNLDESYFSSVEWFAFFYASACFLLMIEILSSECILIFLFFVALNCWLSE